MKYLIIIDMQKDFVTGALGSDEARRIIPAVEAKAADSSYDKVFYTFDTHYDDYMDTLEGKKLPVPHCIRGTDGWNSVLSSVRGELIEKNTFGYDGWFEKLGKLGRGDSIEIIGVCTDICVVSNALILRALYPDTPIAADASCCAGTTVDAHKAALIVMKSCQIDVINERGE